MGDNMYLYGKNVIKELLNTNVKKIQKIYLYENFNDQNLISSIEKSKICVEYMTKVELDRLANGNHQGIIVVVSDYEYANIEELINEDNALIVILDHLEDPHNFGAIIRTCEAAGVSGIIIPKDRSVSVNSTVAKVSTGAIERMKIARVTNLNRTIEKLKQNGFWIVGTDMNGEDYSTIDYNGKIAIVIGNEGKGLSEMVKKNCDFIASIPMYGKINSLNASVATGIVIYEAVRHRK